MSYLNDGVCSNTPALGYVPCSVCGNPLHQPQDAAIGRVKPTVGWKAGQGAIPFERRSQLAVIWHINCFNLSVKGEFLINEVSR